MIYNIQQRPELAKIDLGTVAISYTKHARKRSEEKMIWLPNEVKISGNVVEMETNNQTGKPRKIIVRISHDSQYDLVIALVPADEVTRGKLLATTVWLNHKNDNHKTLRKSRVAA